jgi:hypothetical protein
MFRNLIIDRQIIGHDDLLDFGEDPHNEKAQNG